MRALLRELLFVFDSIEMYLGENYRRRNVSTGDTIGKYKIFNENGFLRSLELDVMDAKGKFE